MIEKTSDWVKRLFLGGYFVEAGAHDGVGDSVTKELEDAGWSGLCVEPSQAFIGLQQSRKCSVDNRCLWNVDDAVVEFLECTIDQELSGIKASFRDHWDRAGRQHVVREKRTVTLPTLLQQHNAPSVIQFMSLDTEGSELEILKAHDWDRYKILSMVVEHNGVDEYRTAIREYLGLLGYSMDIPQPYAIEDRWVLK